MIQAEVQKQGFYYLEKLQFSASPFWLLFGFWEKYFCMW